MKKFFILLSVLFMSVLLIACSSSTSTPKSSITPEIESKILALTENVNQIAIDRVEDHSTYFAVWVEFLYTPETVQEVEAFLTAVCKDCSRIAKDNELKMSVNVWGFRPVGEDSQAIFGRVHYDRHTDSYEYKTAKELNL